MIDLHLKEQLIKRGAFGKLKELNILDSNTSLGDNLVQTITSPVLKFKKELEKYVKPFKKISEYEKSQVSKGFDILLGREIKPITKPSALKFEVGKGLTSTQKELAKRTIQNEIKLGTEEVKNWQPNVGTFLNTFTDTFLPTKVIITLADRMGFDSVNNYRDIELLKEKHPVAAAIPMLVGTFANFNLLSGAGKQAYIKSELPRGIRNLAPTLSRAVQGAAKTGTIFGLNDFFTELFDQIRKDKFSLKDLTTRTLSGAGAGAAFGIGGATLSPTKRIIGTGLSVGGVDVLETLIRKKKIEPQDWSRIVATGLAASLFEAIGTKQKTEFYRRGEIEDLGKEMMIRRVMRNTKLPYKKAESIVDTINVLSGIPYGRGNLQMIPESAYRQVLKEIPKSFYAMPKEMKYKYMNEVVSKIEKGSVLKDAVKLTNQTEIGKKLIQAAEQIIKDQRGFAKLPEKEIPKELEPLAEEAKKYKSAEEFVKNLEKNKKIVYHGTNKKFDKFDLSKARTSGYSNIGIWFSNKLEAAQTYGKRIIKSYLPKNSKFLEFDNWEDFISRVEREANYRQDIQLGEEYKAFRDAFQKDYIGVKIGPVKIDDAPKQIIYVIFNPKQIITEQQLKDFYNQVVKPEKKVEVKKQFPKIKTGKEQLIERDRIKKERELVKLKRENLKFPDGELEDQYQRFKKLKVKDAEDVEQLKIKNKSVKPEEIDNILYSQEKTADEIFEIFKDRYLKEKEPLPKIPKETKAIFAAKKIEKIKTAKQILDRRREFIRAVQKHFDLSDSDLKSIAKRDIRLMSNFEFKKYLDDIWVKAEKLAEERQKELENISAGYHPKAKLVKPEDVPIKPLKHFKNFIDLNKIDKKDIPYKELGIATLYKDGKEYPAIRKSGFFATKDIEGAPIRDIYRATQAPHNMALMQDQYKPGKEFGVVYKKMWLPVQKAIRNGFEFKVKQTSRVSKILKRYKIKPTDKELTRLSDIIEGKTKGTEREKKALKEIRELFDNLREQANEVRRLMGKKEIGYIENYIPHIQKATLWNELLNNVATISDNLDFIIPNQAKNPFAYKRVLDELPKAERNLGVLLDRYINAIAKDIYFTPAIEHLKAYNRVLKNRELFNAAKYWDEYIRFGLVGKQYKIDTSISMGLKGRKAAQKWNDMVNKAFLTGKLSWNIATQPLSYLMPGIKEVGLRNSIKAIVEAFNKGLRRYVKENSDVLNIKSSDVRSVAIGEGREIINRIYRTKIDKWNDMLSFVSSVLERELTLASYLGGLERAKQLGYKGEDALIFADLASARSQSMYNRENRALILDSDIMRTIFPFQSFNIEMFNHAKEILTKERGAMQLTYRQRLGALYRLLIGIYLSYLYTKALTGRKKTTVGTFIPFVGSYVDRMIAKMRGEEYYGGRSPITVIQISDDIIKGAKDWVKYGNAKRLRKVGLNFGLSLFGAGGGAQINNIIDGIIADITGEVKSVSGKRLFKVEDLIDKIKAPIFGVWATNGGREYWEKRTTTKKKKTKTKKLIY